VAELIEEVFCPHCDGRIIKLFEKAPNGLFGNIMKCPLCKEDFMVNCCTVRDKDKPSIVNIKEVIKSGDIDDEQTTLSEFYDHSVNSSENLQSDTSTKMEVN